MKYIAIPIALALLAGCTSNPSNNISSSLEAGAKHSAKSGQSNTFAPHVDGQILVRFNDGVETETVAAILKDYNCQVLTRYNDSQLFHLELPEDLSVNEALAEFGSLEEVAFAEPNYVLGTEPYDI